MAQIDQIEVGETTYDLVAQSIASPANIDGVSFDGNGDISHYSVCSTSAATAAKTVGVDGFSLVTGARVEIKFLYGNTAANPTLNVNETGAIPLVVTAGSTSVAAASGTWAAGELLTIVYDGANYVIEGAATASTTTNGRVRLDSTPTSGSGNALTSGGAYTALSTKAPLASPALTGTPTAPTAAAGTNTTQIATTAFVQNEIADVAPDGYEIGYMPSGYGDIVAALCPPLEASGAIASGYFQPGSNLDVTVGVEPAQSGTGDPSPTNVRPITGWSAIRIYTAGRNLLDNIQSQESSEISGVTFTKNSDGSIGVNGTSTAAEGSTSAYLLWSRAATGNLARRLPAGSYVLSGCPAGGSTTTFWMRAQCTRNGSLVALGTDTGSGVTFTVQDGDALQIQISVASGATADNLTFFPMVRLASDTNAAYEQYAGSIYPVTISTEAGTVYGGAYNTKTGALTVDRALVTYDGSETWSASGSYANTFYRRLTSTKVEGDIISNLFAEETTGLSSIGVWQTFYASNGNLFFRADSTITSVDDWKAWLADNPVQVVYPLEQSVSYAAPTVVVPALGGISNVWCDAGDVTVDGYESLVHAISEIRGAGA